MGKALKLVTNYLPDTLWSLPSLVMKENSFGYWLGPVPIDGGLWNMSCWNQFGLNIIILLFTLTYNEPWPLYRQAFVSRMLYMALPLRTGWQIRFKRKEQHWKWHLWDGTQHELTLYVKTRSDAIKRFDNLESLTSPPPPSTPPPPRTPVSRWPPLPPGTWVSPQRVWPGRFGRRRRRSARRGSRKGPAGRRTIQGGPVGTLAVGNEYFAVVKYGNGDT